MNSHWILLSLISVLTRISHVSCYSCYQGSEGNLNITPVTRGTVLCSFQVIDPCDKSKIHTYHAFQSDHTFSRRCYFRDSDKLVACSCDTDLCNRDVDIIRRRLEKTIDLDPEVRKCVEDRLNELERKLKGWDTTTTKAPNQDQGNDAHMSNRGQQQTGKKAKDRSGGTSDFIIFLILVVVAVILLVAIIPALLYCLTLKNRRSQRKSLLMFHEKIESLVLMPLPYWRCCAHNQTV
ncbi:unnamed protein product [Cylicocyclus nassatus]|uniref:Uncharacterized protein n=1 Tax=Cylicocyclus nassatus TaxID=53992 RepID=A0AA36DJV4_CYLNA|nr:unnamed protein product [Cylicocyclus nassatus]